MSKRIPSSIERILLDEETISARVRELAARISDDYTDDHVVPPELGGDPPTITIATPVGFVDGHAKYWRGSFYSTIGLLTTPNEIQ